MAPHIAAGRIFPEKLYPAVQLDLLMDFVCCDVSFYFITYVLKHSGIRLLTRKCWCEFGSLCMEHFDLSR